MIVVLIIVIAPTAYVGDKMSERKRRKAIQRFKQTRSSKLRPKDEFFFKTYDRDSGALLSMLSLISDPEALQSAYARLGEYRERGKEPVHARSPHDLVEMNYVDNIWFASREIDACLKSGLVQKTHEGLVVNEHMRGVLKEFVAFLKKEDLLPESDTSRVANSRFAQSYEALLSDEEDEEGKSSNS